MATADADARRGGWPGIHRTCRPRTAAALSASVQVGDDVDACSRHHIQVHPARQDGSAAAEMEPPGFACLFNHDFRFLKGWLVVDGKGVRSRPGQIPLPHDRICLLPGRGRIARHRTAGPCCGWRPAVFAKSPAIRFPGETQGHGTIVEALVAINSGSPRACSRLPATRETKVWPVSVSTGQPTHKASLAVVWAQTGKVSRNRSASR